MEKILSESNKIIKFFCTDKYISYLTQEDGWIIYDIELKTKYIVPFNKNWINDIRYILITNDNKYVLITGKKTFLLHIIDNSLTELLNFEDYQHYNRHYYNTVCNFIYASDKNIFYIAKHINQCGITYITKLFSYNPETKQDILITDNWTLYVRRINHNNKTYLVANWTDGKFSFYDPDTFTEKMDALLEIHKSNLYDELLNKYNKLNNNISYTYYIKNYRYFDYINGDIIYKKLIVDTYDSFQLDYETNTIYSKHDNAIYKFDINNYLTEFYTLLNDYHIPPEIQDIILKYI